MARIVVPEKKLSAIASFLDQEATADISITGISNSSKEILPGDLFVATKGTVHDGELFVDQAFAAGASAALVTKESSLGGRPGLLHPAPERILSTLAGELLGNPSQALLVIGVTGTNGKTTTTWMLQSLLVQLGMKTLRIGTLGAQLTDGFTENFGLTTPDPIALQSLLARAKADGAQAVVMEVSSHALDQYRVDGVSFNGVGFTNLSRDHLDYHQTMDEYLLAKARLFELAAHQPGSVSVAWNKDEWGAKLQAAVRHLPLQLFFLSHENVKTRQTSLTGSSFELLLEAEPFVGTIPLIGEHNIENAALAFTLLYQLGLPVEISQLPALSPVPGRLEGIQDGGRTCFVDYAHTPDALEKMLRTLRPLTPGRLWVVFGCGGDRDRGKRRIMGGVAARFADEIVVTSDNPRTEDPQAIINEILLGCSPRTTAIIDRRKAIQFMVKHMSADDVGLVAGKGHEDYQIIGTTKHHFSDTEEIRLALSAASSDVHQ